MSNSNQQLAKLVSTVIAHLEVERELGEEAIPLHRRDRPTDQPTSIKTAKVSAGKPQKLSVSEKKRRLHQLEEEATRCVACALHKSRTQAVFSRGSVSAQLVFVGEGPGQEEDRQGIPFVGQAGQLLDRMITAMGFQREDVYICNVVKCRPPKNRTPFFEEAKACERFLTAQLELISPRVIVALGKCAAVNLHVASVTGSWRGLWKKWHEIPVMPTYHPAFLLRSPNQKKVVWEDLQAVMKRLHPTY